MPNWTEHELHVVGKKADIDRFVRVGYRKRERELDFARLCPPRPGEVYQPDCGLVNIHCRTKTQAFFGMVTAWDYVPNFYEQLPTHWPDLAFGCAINAEMGDFGGVLMALDGEIVDLVREYGAKGYDRRKHAREVGRVMKRFTQFLTEGREWRVLAHDAWEHRSMPVDAHFDDDFSFYFTTREEMTAFRKRYRTFFPMRLVAGQWQRTR